MLIIKNNLVIIIFILFLSDCKLNLANALTSSAIPDFLIPCYNGTHSTESTIPLTLPVLIELIRKIELNNKTPFDMRTLTTFLIHGVIFDGVMKSSRKNSLDDDTIPYRARGHTFFKYKLVVDYLIGKPSSAIVLNESLSMEEICYLHHMLSNTIENTHENQNITCITTNITNMPNIGDKEWEKEQSDGCLIVKGNIKTTWGTISVGHLIYGLSAALERSKTYFAKILQAINNTDMQSGTPSTDLADNMLISTIGGDLAEVILNQYQSFELGNSGFWDDIMLPHIFYLNGKNADMTEAKILGGIDAIILGNQIEYWMNHFKTLRLSQLLDMYYSRDVGFNMHYKASNRTYLFDEIVKQINLTEQIRGTAQLLHNIGTYDFFVDDNHLKLSSSKIAESFLNISDEIIKKYNNIEYIGRKNLQAAAEIILIIDGSYERSNLKKFVYLLAETSQVSYYGSKLGIINGQTGNWMSNVSGEIVHIMAKLDVAPDWPNELNLHRSLETVIAYYRNKTYESCSKLVSKPLGQVVVVLSKHPRLTDTNISVLINDRASIKNIIPEAFFIYVVPQYKQGKIEKFATTFSDSDDAIILNSKDEHALSLDITNYINSIAINIMSYCNESLIRYEDFLTPNVTTSYQIHYIYLQRSYYTIKFIGKDYGDICVCASSNNTEANKICKHVTVNDEIIFYSEEYCPLEGEACTLQFVTEVKKSSFKCIEDGCRFPDQVRMDITWLKSGSNAFTNQAYLMIVSIFSSYICSSSLYF